MQAQQWQLAPCVMIADDAIPDVKAAERDGAFLNRGCCLYSDRLLSKFTGPSIIALTFISP